MAASLEERYKIIGRNLKFERTRRSLTQEELAGLMGSDVRTVRRHETDGNMDFETLISYSNALDCSCEDLFDEKKGNDARVMKAFVEAKSLPKNQRDRFLNLLGMT